MIEVLLDSVDIALRASGLLADYETQLHSWDDSEQTRASRIMVLRKTGDGPSDKLVQQLDVGVLLIGQAGKPSDLANLAGSLVRHVRLGADVAATEGLSILEVVVPARSPNRLVDGRPFCEMTLRAYCEDM